MCKPCPKAVSAVPAVPRCSWEDCRRGGERRRGESRGQNDGDKRGTGRNRGESRVVTGRKADEEVGQSGKRGRRYRGRAIHFQMTIEMAIFWGNRNDEEIT